MRISTAEKAITRFAQFAACAGLAVALSTTTAIAESAIKPGLWEITVNTPKPIPGSKATVTTKTCISKDNPDFLDEIASEKCEVTERSEDEGTFKWKWRCKVENIPTPIVGEGEAKVDGDQVSGTTKVTITLKDQKLEIDSKIGGKRTGDCP